MEFIRVGDKVISRDRIYRTIDEILRLRAGGASQQDVAAEMGVDRSFISRLEGIGEIRKGRRIALIGFPVVPKDELNRVAIEEGCELIFLMTNDERWQWVDRVSGVELLNEVMMLIAKLKDFDNIIFIGSDMRIKLIETVIGKEVIPILIGESPITEDKYIDPEVVRQVIKGIKASEGVNE